MQIMIDTAAESPADLRRIAAMLVFAASQVEGSAAVPAGTVIVASPPAAPIVPVVPALPAVEVMKADAGHASELPDPAKVFGGASNVVPLVPSLPTPPAAEVATAPAAALAASGPVELDGAGFPWDARIHSGTPTKNANGLWRMRRGVLPNVIQDVEAELRTNYPAPTNAAPLVPLPPSVPVAPVVPAPPVAPAVPVTLPGVPTPGSPVQAPVVAGVPSGNDAFRLMMDKFSKEMGANGRLNKTVMAPIFATLGVTGWQEFFKRPELIPNVTAEAERLLA